MEQMQAFLKEVGRGKKGAKDLPLAEARQAAELIFNGTATTVQTAAFLMAERIKSETVEELQAFVEAARAQAEPIAHEASGLLDCAGPYDGRAKSFAATIPVALVLAAVGAPVLLHGSETLPPKYGTSIREIWQALGLPVPQTKEQIARSLGQRQAVFLDTERFCAPLQKLRGLRVELGLRTLLNTVEKYLNLGQAEFVVAGVFHSTALEKSAELVSRLPYRKAMIVQGVDGSEDVPVNRPSQLYVVENGTMEKHLIDPKAYGLHAASESVQWSAAEQANRIEQVLQGVCETEETLALRRMVLLNSGLRLWLTERVERIEDGIERAKQALDSGLALAKLNEWRRE